MRKFIWRMTLLAAFSSAAVSAGLVASLKPSLKELFSLRFYLEVPQRLMMKAMAFIFPFVASGWGEEGVKALQYLFYEAGRARAKLMRESLEIDPDDARSIGRVLDFEDRLVGVRGVWTEETRGRAVKEERYCPMARELTKCPEVCTHLMMAMEAGTFAGWIPRVKMPEISKLLSTGDDCCYAAIELIPEKGKEAADCEISPQADSSFPPVIKVPWLLPGMLITVSMGLAKAVLELLLYGPNAVEMEYYDFIRYQPAED